MEEYGLINRAKPDYRGGVASYGCSKLVKSDYRAVGFLQYKKAGPYGPALIIPYVYLMILATMINTAPIISHMHINGQKNLTHF